MSWERDALMRTGTGHHVLYSQVNIIQITVSMRFRLWFWNRSHVLCVSHSISEFNRVLYISLIKIFVWHTRTQIWSLQIMMKGMLKSWKYSVYKLLLDKLRHTSQCHFEYYRLVIDQRKFTKSWVWSKHKAHWWLNRIQCLLQKRWQPC